VRESYATIKRLLGSDRVYKLHEAVDVRAIGEEPDDIARIVDAIDDGSGDAERGSMARTRGVELHESGSIKSEAVGITPRSHKGADDEVFATTEGLCARRDHAIDSDIEGCIWPPEWAEKAVVVVFAINPESADYIIVVDATRLCRDRTIKELQVNFSKFQGGARKVDNETVFVAAAVRPESGSQIRVVDAEKVLITCGGSIWIRIKDSRKHALDILKAKLKAVLIRPKPDDDGHFVVVNADGLGLCDRMARRHRPREVLY
jgi:hypothetical protein